MFCKVKIHILLPIVKTTAKTGKFVIVNASLGEYKVNVEFRMCVAKRVIEV